MCISKRLSYSMYSMGRLTFTPPFYQPTLKNWVLNYLVANGPWKGGLSEMTNCKGHRDGNVDDNSICWHVLRSYYGPSAILNSFYLWAYLVFTKMLWKYPLFFLLHVLIFTMGEADPPWQSNYLFQMSRLENADSLSSANTPKHH